MTEKTYLVKELPAVLGVSISTTYAILATGALPFTIPSHCKTRHRTVTDADVQAFLAQRKAKHKT